MGFSPWALARQQSTAMDGNGWQRHKEKDEKGESEEEEQSGPDLAEVKKRFSALKRQFNKTEKACEKTRSSKTAIKEQETPKPKNVEKHKNNKKIGRNDPCDCGSGLKYKKCHG